MGVIFPLNGLLASDNTLEQLSFLPGLGGQKGSAITGCTSLVAMTANLDIAELLDFVIELLVSIPEDAEGTRSISAYEMELLLTTLRTVKKGGRVE